MHSHYLVTIAAGPALRTLMVNITQISYTVIAVNHLTHIIHP